MAITFVKDTNGKVLVTKNGVEFGLDASMNILPHPSDGEIIIISDSSAPLEAREVLKFGWQEVTIPANTSRNDLIDKLAKNFFFLSFSATVSTAGLATETKQDAQIVNQGTETAPPPSGTKVLGWLQNIYSKLAGTISVSGSVTANAGTDLNTSALNLESTQALIKAKTDNLDVALSTRSSESTLLTVRDNVGATSETAAGSDTATSGLNGLIKRLLQKITTQFPTSLIGGRFDINIGSWFGSTVPTVGQKASASSIPVVLPSDQIVSISSSNDIATTQATSTVVYSTTSVLVIASNSNRRQVTITNFSNKRMYLCLFTPAVTYTPFFLDKEQTWIFPKWKGAIYALWDSAGSGNAYVTEENP